MEHPSVSSVIIAALTPYGESHCHSLPKTLCAGEQLSGFFYLVDDDTK